MTPREQAELLYEKYRQPRSFNLDIYFHRRSGYVIDTPDYFLMGRPVQKHAPEHLIRDPAIRFSSAIADAWFIWIFVGDIKMMLHLAPFPLPYVGWSRRHGPIRWYTCEEALSRVKRYDDYRTHGRDLGTRGEACS